MKMIINLSLLEYLQWEEFGLSVILKLCCLTFSPIGVLLHDRLHRFFKQPKKVGEGWVHEKKFTNIFLKSPTLRVGDPIVRPLVLASSYPCMLA
jgi:hypothetical protein